jgi:hypothetical protein
MTLYHCGKVWWYEFEFRGQRIRESTRSRTKSIAERIERERRRQLGQKPPQTSAIVPNTISVSC